MDEKPTITPAVATDWYWLPAETGPAVPVAGSWCTSVAACTAVVAADYQHHTLPVVVHTYHVIHTCTYNTCTILFMCIAKKDQETEMYTHTCTLYMYTHKQLQWLYLFMCTVLHEHIRSTVHSTGY